MTPAAGTVLVATPALGDPNFMRSVVYLVEHSGDGALGFIVNRPLNTILGELWSEVPEGLAHARTAADGGPVERQKGLLLHACPDLPGCQPMSPGVAIGGDLEALAERFANGPDRGGPRLFLGHSGWGAGQLEREIRAGSWLVRPGQHAWLVDPASITDLWHRLSTDRPGGMPQPSLN